MKNSKFILYILALMLPILLVSYVIYPPYKKSLFNMEADQNTNQIENEISEVTVLDLDELDPNDFCQKPIFALKIVGFKQLFLANNNNLNIIAPTISLVNPPPQFIL